MTRVPPDAAFRDASDIQVLLQPVPGKSRIVILEFLKYSLSSKYLISAMYENNENIVFVLNSPIPSGDEAGCQKSGSFTSSSFYVKAVFRHMYLAFHIHKIILVKTLISRLQRKRAKSKRPSVSKFWSTSIP